MSSPAKPRAVVYVDGFNLYYLGLKRTPFKWLNLLELARLHCPQFDIQAVKYFSAPVKPHPNYPASQAHIKQQTYFRALGTVAGVEIILGTYLRSETRMPLLPLTTPPTMVRVEKSEEKGSDVNVATHLLCDAFDNTYDVAVLISNDSDLLLPVQTVRAKFGKKVHIIFPFQLFKSRNPKKKRGLPRRSYALQNNCDSFSHLDRANLSLAQFPVTLTDPNGTFTKPPSW